MAEGASQLPTNNANTAELSSSSVIPIGADTRIAQQPQDNWWLPTFPAMVTLLVGWAILWVGAAIWLFVLNGETGGSLEQRITSLTTPLTAQAQAMVDSLIDQAQLFAAKSPAQQPLHDSHGNLFNPSAIGSGTTNNGTAIPLEQVHNVGYTFYLGQIDRPGTPPLSDDTKNTITKVLAQIGFPKSLLSSVGIVVANSLAVTPDMYVSAPVTGLHLKVSDPAPEFLFGGGEYDSYADPATNQRTFSVVMLDKTLFEPSTLHKLQETLTHELGHDIGSMLSDADWTTYYSLQGIPPGTPRGIPLGAPRIGGEAWVKSPEEDFAEVYKNVVSGLDIRTIYGTVVPVIGSAPEYEPTCGGIYGQVYQAKIKEEGAALGCSGENASDIKCPYGMWQDTGGADAAASANPQVQTCWRGVLLQHAAADQLSKSPYKSTVGPKTNAFINTVLARFQ
jgi:hypothetical protein